MQQDYDWMQRIAQREGNTGMIGQPASQKDIDIEEILDILERIDRGFDDIERRIANMDREHMKYVKATVVRLNYLLNQEGSMQGMVVQILNQIATRQKPEEDLKKMAEQINLSGFQALNEKSLYRRRAPKKNFIENLQPQAEQKELSKEDILKLNQIHHRYSRQQVEEFLELHADAQGTIQITEDTVKSDEDFEKLILAYDYAGKKNSKYRLLPNQEAKSADNGRYCYPKLTFISISD